MAVAVRVFVVMPRALAAHIRAVGVIAAKAKKLLYGVDDDDLQPRLLLWMCNWWVHGPTRGERRSTCNFVNNRALR